MISTEKKKTRNSIDIAKKCARLLEEKKADQTLLIDLREVNSYLDYFIISTGNSMIHCRSLSREIKKFMSSLGFKQRNRPEFDTSWFVLDYDDIVIHVFTQDARSFYQLERLWADARRIDFS